MSDEESLDNKNLINLVLFHKSKLKKIQKGASAGKLFTREERRKLKEYGIIEYQKRTWKITEKGKRIIDPHML